MVWELPGELLAVSEKCQAVPPRVVTNKRVTVRRGTNDPPPCPLCPSQALSERAPRPLIIEIGQRQAHPSWAARSWSKTRSSCSWAAPGLPATYPRAIAAPLPPPAGSDFWPSLPKSQSLVTITRREQICELLGEATSHLTFQPVYYLKKFILYSQYINSYIFIWFNVFDCVLHICSPYFSYLRWTSIFVTISCLDNSLRVVSDNSGLISLTSRSLVSD